MRPDTAALEKDRTESKKTTDYRDTRQEVIL